MHIWSLVEWVILALLIEFYLVEKMLDRYNAGAEMSRWPMIDFSTVAQASIGKRKD